MLKKLVVALIASAFALGAYAQAQKAEPKGQTGTTTQAATPSEGKSEKIKKAKAKSTKKSAKAKPADAKDSRKDAPKEPKKDKQ
jgi:hypothetical protein